FFFFSSSRRHPPLHSFPTRRSSDLPDDSRLAMMQLAHGVEQMGDVRRAGFHRQPHLLAGGVRVADRDGDATLADRGDERDGEEIDRKSTRLNSSHVSISYAVFCLKK